MTGSRQTVHATMFSTPNFPAVIFNHNGGHNTVIVKKGWSNKRRGKVAELPNGTVVDCPDAYSDHDKSECVAYLIHFDPRDNVDKEIIECPEVEMRSMYFAAATGG